MAIAGACGSACRPASPGLALWSFLMASAHGAGLMLIPVVMPLCLAGVAGAGAHRRRRSPIALAALGVHTAAMLATIAAIALVVYRWVGVAFLRRGWINLDLVWTAALLVCGDRAAGRVIGPAQAHILDGT